MIKVKLFTLVTLFTAIGLVVSFNSRSIQAEPVQQSAAAPIKVLMITGGGWHDYERQSVILKETIESRLNAVVDVRWTSTQEHPVKQVDTKIPHVFTTDFSKGYDVVLHNHCHVGFQDDAVINGVIDNHIQNKVGVILTHGAFHSFKTSPDEAWDRICGCNSIRHVQHCPLEITIMDKDHPVTRALGVDGWQTSQGELYTTELNEGTRNLAEGTTLKGPKKTDSCVFTHVLKEGNRVMGITLGHHNSTMEQEEYRQLIVHSVLWVAGKYDDNGALTSGYLVDAQSAPVPDSGQDEGTPEGF
jgi:type 1 glutamine amidotransferase